MGKPPGDEQEVHTRPTGWDDLAQHSDCHGSDSDLLKNAKRYRRSSQREDKSSHLAPQVNGTLGWWRIWQLPGEISLALRSVKAGSVRRGNTADDRGEVSRSHSSWDKTNWGAEIARLNYETHGTNHPAKG
jgi:hypothetical protein